MNWTGTKITLVLPMTGTKIVPVGGLAQKLHHITKNYKYII